MRSRFDHLRRHTGDLAKLHAARLPRQVQSLRQIRHVSQMNLHLIDCPGDFTVCIHLPETFACRQTFGDTMTSNGTNLIES
ncbi:hypothetical protein D3C81_1386710 [compost metagenome]